MRGAWVPTEAVKTDAAERILSSEQIAAFLNQMANKGTGTCKRQKNGICKQHRTGQGGDIDR
jgi:hypothetical protein